MAVTLRLQRVGRRKRPFYRLVAADESSPRDGRFIEILGQYDPKQTPSTITVEAERVQHWIGHGAKVSATVRTLLKQSARRAKAGPLTPPSPARGEGAEKGAGKVRVKATSKAKAKAKAQAQAQAKEAPAQGEETTSADAPV